MIQERRNHGICLHNVIGDVLNDRSLLGDENYRTYTKRLEEPYGFILQALMGPCQKHPAGIAGASEVGLNLSRAIPRGAPRALAHPGTGTVCPLLALPARRLPGIATCRRSSKTHRLTNLSKGLCVEKENSRQRSRTRLCVSTKAKTIVSFQSHTCLVKTEHTIRNSRCES